MKLKIGFSPCPNDTFMFDAMINGKIDHDIDWEVKMADIEQLNSMAFEGELDVTKISYHALMYLTDIYQILDSGSALGHDCGPLLLSMLPEMGKADISNARIAIPGKFTTANMLLNLAYPNATNKQAVLFSEIEDAICDGSFDLGLVIHENRFTYQSKGLHKIIDLGAYWEERTNLPIPLGAIVVKRSLPERLKQDINQTMKASIQYAFDQPKSSVAFVADNAQAMEEAVMYQHIALYVNEYSLDLGAKGKESVQKLADLLVENGTISKVHKHLFL